MDEADTIERVKSRRVQVASLPPADSGRGFARLSGQERIHFLAGYTAIASTNSVRLSKYGYPKYSTQNPAPSPFTAHLCARHLCTRWKQLLNAIQIIELG